MTKYEIILGGVSFVTTSVASVLAWKMGGRQRVENERADAITVGTEKIVDTSTKLLERMEELLQQEKERTAIEREHRESCEEKLDEHMKLIRELRNEIDEIKKNEP